jgi:hypothetical protein
VVVTVGLTADCDYNLTQNTSLHDTINNTSNTEIRVTLDTIAAPITIDRRLVLSGGYDD